MIYESVVDLFFALTKIDSPSGEEAQVAEFVAGILRDLGLNPELDANNNLYCRIGAGDNPLLICNHLDTVEPGRNIEPFVDEGVIRSGDDTILGGDNKAALAAALFALQGSDRSSLNIELLFTVCEETTSGIKNFDMSRLESRRAIVIDGGGGELSWLAERAPTIIDFEFTVRGKASHSSRPEEGNSVLPFLSELILDYKPGRIDENTTYNLGTVYAGDAVNTVPAVLVIEGDIRSTDHASSESFRTDLLDYMTKLCKTHKLSMEGSFNDYCRAYEIDTDTDFFKQISEVYAGLGIVLDPVNTTSASDAAHLRKHGIDAFCLGDGVKNPHETSEHIEVETLSKLVEIYNHLIKKESNE